jgi:hypothetical protein
MSLESQMESLTAAVLNLVNELQTKRRASESVPVAPPAPVALPAPTPDPVFPHSAPPAPPAGMPAAPFPGTPPAPVEPTVPFNTPQGLLEWAKAHGLGNITDARPDQYPSLYAAINVL